MNTPRYSPASRRPAGFTLVELLTVMAIIAILSAILVPAVTIAMKQVRDSKTRVQLSNIVMMSRMYHEQYKVWPALGTDDKTNDTAFSLKENAPRWVHMMTGKPEEPDLKYNKLRMPFASFNDSDLSPNPETVTPIDAYYNDDLYLVFNTNLANLGQIQPDVVNGITMNTVEGKIISVTQNGQIPINEDCVSLSPGQGVSNIDAITTWALQTEAP